MKEAIPYALGHKVYTEKAKEEICEMITKLSEDPAIIPIGNYLVSLEQSLNLLLNQMSTEMKAIYSNHIKTQSNFVSSRILGQVPSIQPLPKDLFRGDIVLIKVPKVDSSYLSYQGALGTTGNESHKFHKEPLDINVAFP